MFRLLLITDPRPDLPHRVRRALSGSAPGSVAVCLRWKAASARELLAQALELRKVTSDAGAAFLVNERADVARSVGAQGVHLPAAGMPVKRLREWWPDVRVGRSTHDPDELAAAREEGCEWVTYGPVFDTPSKRGLLPPRGLPGLRQARTVLGDHGPALFALGGIEASQRVDCLDAGAHGVACIRAVLDASDPGLAVARLTSP